MTTPGKPNLIDIVASDGQLTNSEFLDELGQNPFPDSHAARWLRARTRLHDAGYGAVVVDAYVRASTELVKHVGPHNTIALADLVSSVAIKSGRIAAEAMSHAALTAAHRLDRDAGRFRSWLGLMERFTNLAPESVQAVLLQMDKLLTRLNVSRLESWLLAGVRAAGTDPERRFEFFTHADPEAERWLERESGAVVFNEVQRELQSYFHALWGIRAPLRETSMQAPEHIRRRATFGSGIIHVPPTFPGFRGEQASDLFRASVAHIGAHLRYCGKPFPVGKLKPMQVALISLIEDARVEHLAMRDFPGLRRLWLPFHIAQASGVMTAPVLLARLARALIDPDYQDTDGWVRRGREMVNVQRDNWDAQASREIGGLLGNNLGQMRVQFNAKTYVVEPAYRDDNRGLWDFGDQQSSMDMDDEALFDSVNILEQHDDDTPAESEREEHELSEDEQTNPISLGSAEEEGIPVARYAEYDYITGRERPDWTTIVEFAPPTARLRPVADVLERHADVVERIRKLISTARVSRPERLRRQLDGDYLDIDACIEATICRRLGDQPDPRVYGLMERRHRDLSVQVLLDVSESTNDKIRDSDTTV
ncbi:MAG: nitric oxide reductase activation protein NorD, partial [Gammaproteobacteria bacterium]